MSALKMAEQRTSWNDDRLDEHELAGDMKAGFARVDARFDRVDARFDEMDARFDKLQSLIWGFGGTLVVGLIGGVITLVATHAT